MVSTPPLGMHAVVLPLFRCERLQQCEIFLRAPRGSARRTSEDHALRNGLRRPRNPDRRPESVVPGAPRICRKTPSHGNFHVGQMSKDFRDRPFLRAGRLRNCRGIGVCGKFWARREHRFRPSIRIPGPPQAITQSVILGSASSRSAWCAKEISALLSRSHRNSGSTTACMPSGAWRPSSTPFRMIAGHDINHTRQVERIVAAKKK